MSSASCVRRSSETTVIWPTWPWPQPGGRVSGSDGFEAQAHCLRGLVCRPAGLPIPQGARLWVHRTRCSRDAKEGYARCPRREPKAAWSAYGPASWRTSRSRSARPNESHRLTDRRRSPRRPTPTGFRSASGTKRGRSGEVASRTGQAPQARSVAVPTGPLPSRRCLARSSTKQRNFPIVMPSRKRDGG